MAQAARRTALVTVEAFLDLDLDGDLRYELIDGQVVAQASPSPPHSVIQSALSGLLYWAVLNERNARDGSRCLCLTEASIPTPFDAAHNFRQADLAVTCERLGAQDRFIRAPILLAEIISPSEEAKQRAKLHPFSAIPSVQEVLFLDSRRIRAELHRRRPDGSWPAGPSDLIGDETLLIESCGLEVPLSRCYPFLDLPPGER